jgi:spore maturation protein CgeB
VKGISKLLFKIFFRLRFPLDTNGNNREIISRFKNKIYHTLWLDKGVHILPKTLKKVKIIQPHCKIVGYSPDDMLNPNNQSFQFLKSLHLYQVFLTTKSYNVRELLEMGARKVMFVANGYDPDIHKPLNLTDADFKKYNCQVGFVGGFELDRMNKMLDLANSGVEITITGADWYGKIHHRKIIVRPYDVWGSDYAKVINATRINLCFLRRANRDLQTTRTVEIPACKAFMLAERTDEHLDMFQEGYEAEYFSDSKELIGKVKYYLTHVSQIDIIARRGYNRCVASGYSNERRLKGVMDRICENSIAGLR